MKALCVAGCVLVVAQCAFAAPIIAEFVPWATMDGGVNSDGVQGFAITGNSAYAALGPDGAQIVRVDDLAGAQTHAQLLDFITWFIASGTAKLSCGKGFGISGNYLQFADIQADAVWRVNRDTGDVLCYVAKQSVMDFTGQSGVRMLSPQTVEPVTGEHIFYEGLSESILRTTGSNSVEFFVAAAVLSNWHSSSDVVGGMTHDGDGNLYFNRYLRMTNEFGVTNYFYAIQVRQTNGTIQTILDETDFVPLTGSNVHIIGDIIYGGDGFVYVKTGSNTEGNLLRFDPANPAGTLAVFLSEDDLTNSVAASPYLDELGWYDTSITWTKGGPNPIYRVVPEPVGGLAALALTIAAVVRAQGSGRNQ